MNLSGAANASIADDHRRRDHHRRRPAARRLRRRRDARSRATPARPTPCSRSRSTAPSGRTVTVDWATDVRDAPRPAPTSPRATARSPSRPGQTSKTVSVAVKGDTLDEFDETFTVDLDEPRATPRSAGRPGRRHDHRRRRARRPQRRATSRRPRATPARPLATLHGLPRRAERQDRLRRLDHATTRPPSAGSDYAGGSGTLTFTPGQTTKTVSVNVSGDVTFEADETFTVDLSNVANATVADAQATGTITQRRRRRRPSRSATSP